MSLKELNGHLQDEYRSDSTHLIQDFYVPCLERSVTYSRAVGFFASTSMAVAASGLQALIKAGGKMRLIASPVLSEEDIDAIKCGLKKREEVLAKVVIKELEQDFDKVINDRLECLAWLLANNCLDIKLALSTNEKTGIYHEKLGIFSDAEGNIVAFTGSANESASALLSNFECIDVFVSWDDKVRERALKKAKNFELLWENQTANVEIVSFPEAAQRCLLRYRPVRAPSIDDGEIDVMSQFLQGVSSTPPGCPRRPGGLVLRQYQNDAIRNWLRNQGRGTMKMATGSGKTMIALSAITELYERIKLQCVIIVCPYRHLVTQWARESAKFGLEPVLAFNTTKSWETTLSNQLYNVRSGKQEFVSIIITNSTLTGSAFQSLIEYLPNKTAIVGDEAHNLGAPKLERSLPRSVPIRLGLSATPERYFDDSGTSAILDYFGEVLKPEFTLRDAISAGALVHYLYYPIIVELTDDEAEIYEELTKKIGKLWGKSLSAKDDPILTALLVKRARLVGAAENKLPALEQLMRDRLKSTHTLFYCGDGSVESEIDGSVMRQVEAVRELLNNKLHYKAETYTAETSLEDREDMRREFERGRLPGIVAIRCLDEGVDIPATRTAFFLASSANPRQFVQRRGRVLRLHKDKSRAEIFDMIVAPPDAAYGSFEVERQLLRGELRRFVEFADLADNNGAARLKLLPLQKRYGLMDL